MKTNKTGVSLLAFSLMVAAAIWSATAQSRPQKMGQMENCREVMQQRQKMMSEMKAQNSELEDLATQLEQASGEKKVDLLAQIVTRMVQQRSQNTERMQAMQSRIMQHMSRHMQRGGQSLAQCPMLQAMEGMGGAETEEDQHETGHNSSGSK